MSGGHFTRSQVSASRCLREGPYSARDTIHDIFTNAAHANRSPNVERTVRELYNAFEAYNNTLPIGPEPSRTNLDFSAQRHVGWEHHTEVSHNDCTSFCTQIYLRITYYPQTTHESHQTASLCIEYCIRKPSGVYERASKQHLLLFDRWYIKKPQLLEFVVHSIRFSNKLQEFNLNLALWMAIDIWRQVRDSGQYIYRDSDTDTFLNGHDESERFLGFWETLKDGICKHLFTGYNTYFDSREIGLLI
ncbi:hypothetical protein FSHL1_006495 [Fusarium sambucinum]